MERNSDRNDAARREAERLAAAALAAASFATKNLSRRMAQRARSSSSSAPVPSGLGDELAALASLANRFLGGGDDRGSDRRDDRADDRGGRDAGRGRHVANGSDECCVCPVCRVISAVRDPAPEFSERIATGASDLASGVATVLRAFGNAAGRGRVPWSRSADDRVTEERVADDQVADEVDVEALVVEEPLREDDAEPTEVAWGDFGSVWQTATRAPFDAPDAPPPVAKKTVAKKAVAKKAVEEGREEGRAGEGDRAG